MHKKNIKKSLTGFPNKQGLYNPKHEKDACGFGFIANLDNIPKHEIIHQALEIVHNLDHRGAVSADPLAGDGAGLLIQVPIAASRRFPFKILAKNNPNKV